MPAKRRSEASRTPRYKPRVLLNDDTSIYIEQRQQRHPDGSKRQLFVPGDEIHLLIVDLVEAMHAGATQLLDELEPESS